MVTHIEKSRLEHEIIKEERQYYSAQCSGDKQRMEELRRDLDYLNRQYWEKTGKPFHNGYQGRRV